jgi:hypothetical protein
MVAEVETIMNADDFPRLVFDHDFDERVAYEVNLKGHFGGVKVQLADGSLHPLFFYDPARITQDLEEESKQGRPFIAEKGMILVAEITLDNMERAVKWLDKHGFFR